jgi:hypothetical protein
MYASKKLAGAMALTSEARKIFARTEPHRCGFTNDRFRV